MRKIIRYIAILLFSFLWFLGCSKDCTKMLYEKGYLADDYRYGDLYRLCNLPKFRVLKENCKDKNQSKENDESLFLAGDSFTEEGRISTNDFICKNYFRFHVSKSNPAMQPVKGKKILIIETVERHFRERFATVWNNVSFEPKIVQKITLKDSLLALKMPYNNERHESIIFGFDFMMQLRELKAQFNYWLFNKVDDKVMLSKDGKYLLYGLDTNPGISSGFVTIENSEIDTLVKHVNLTYENYRKLGFDEVFLSIIPNKSSILGRDIGKYNNLSSRIEMHPNLKMPVISILKEFENEGAKVYEIGDSHWNCQGKQIWIDKTNEALRRVK